MKRSRISTLMGIAILTTGSSLMAQATSSGTFNVSGTIDPSISLTFTSDASGLALTSGTGTSTATLALGHLAAYGYAPPSGVTQALTGTPASAFTVSTVFDVTVNVANSSSATYTLTAQLNNADATNTWSIDSTPVTSSSTATLSATGTYGSAASHTLLLSIPFTETGSISNSINFVATAN